MVISFDVLRKEISCTESCQKSMHGGIQMNSFKLKMSQVTDLAEKEIQEPVTDSSNDDRT
jgi:hypothetical protein